MTEDVILIYFLFITPSKHCAEARQKGLSEDIVLQMTEDIILILFLFIIPQQTLR